jgi:hypothetical protein
VFSSDREVHETEKFLAVGAGRRRFCSGTWQVDTTVVELDLLSIYLYVSFSTFPFLLRVCRSTAMCTAPLLRDILFYRLCYRSSHSLCLSVEAAIRLHINFRLVRLHCTGSVETPGFTPKSPSRFSFFCFFVGGGSKKNFLQKFFFWRKRGPCHPWFFAQHTSSGIVGCLQNSLFCWREDKRARDSFENIPSYQENLHSRFFLF